MLLWKRSGAAVMSVAAAGLLALLLVLLPSSVARAQYPPPTPTPTSSTADGQLECEVEAGADFLIIRCTASGFAPGAQVLVQVHATASAGSAAIAPGVNAAPRAGEEQVDEFTVTADGQGDVIFERTISTCDLTSLRVVGTGESASGDTLEAEDVINDVALLRCAGGVLSSNLEAGGSGGVLSSTGMDWLRWLAVGLWLLTTGVWIANVRDERSPGLPA